MPEPRSHLPIDDVMPEIVGALGTAPNLVLRAPTGAGKTTRVPSALIDAGFADPGKIVVLEPRRLAARAAARRMAQERSCRVGEEIGYHVRFDRQAGNRTRALVVTPGILLRQLQDDPFLESVSVLIFDEFHERSLDCDLALGMARLLQQTVRPDLRLVVMSATLEVERVSAYLGNCPIVTSEGRLHPVEIHYDPRSSQLHWGESIAQAMTTWLPRAEGDWLVFLPGMQEIRQAIRALEPLAARENLALLPLHGDLPPEEQDRALLTMEQRKIVLATNVAETSVTVEGIVGVMDTGVARMQTFDSAVGVDRLELLPIARDAADQRAGRAGRIKPGLCVRLWSEGSHRQRAAQTEPEIRRIDLAGAVLHMLALGETDVAKFPWLETPPPEAVDHALGLLQLLGAVHEGTLTEMGRNMAKLPLHPRLARMMLEGQRLGHADRAALAAAILSERDPFERFSTSTSVASAPSQSDVLDRVEALEAFETHGTKEFALGHLHGGAARFILRARDQLLKTLRQEFRDRFHVQYEVDADEAVLRSLLVAYPDRVARRRRHDPNRGRMVGGRGVRLARQSRVADSDLFVGVDLDDQGSEVLVRQASRVRRDWLAEAALRVETELQFDDEAERVVAVRRVYFHDLPLEEGPTSLPSAERVAEALAAAASQKLERVLPPADSSASQFLRRARWLFAMAADPTLPGMTDDFLRECLAWLCPGKRSFEELRNADWLGVWKAKLTPTQVQRIEREAPERLEVPSGSQIRLEYEPGRPPVLAVRIQEVFGWTETPRIAGGKVRILLHLLAPNYRPQQVTEDLASFWKNTYPLVRKELRARYPKHAWPEDPWTASAERRPRRRAEGG